MGASGRRGLSLSLSADAPLSARKALPDGRLRAHSPLGALADTDWRFSCLEQWTAAVRDSQPT